MDSHRLKVAAEQHVVNLVRQIVRDTKAGGDGRGVSVLVRARLRVRVRVRVSLP